MTLSEYEIKLQAFKQHIDGLNSDEFRMQAIHLLSEPNGTERAAAILNEALGYETKAIRFLCFRLLTESNDHGLAAKIMEKKP